LGLLFREWLTRRMTNAYLDHRAYYHLKVGEKIQNPDERIADDVRTCTIVTLSIVLMLLNAGVTVVAFSGVVWSISPALLLISLLYAGLGSYFAVKLGRPLVGLNSAQFDKDADFRASLIHVRENAELIAFTRREGRLRKRLLERVDALVENMRQIFIVNRNLGFFTTGYFNLMQVVPVLVVAPLFFRGEVEFGVITQSVMAFGSLVSACSLIVSQFQPLSSFTAVLSRLNQLWDAMEQPPLRKEESKIKVEEYDGHIAYDNLTLYSSEDGRVLLKGLTISIPHGTRLLIAGPNEAAKLALFRATADIFHRGEGKITRPSLDLIRFLPQRAYLYPGTLRELLLRNGEEYRVPDQQILETLEELRLDSVLARAGGLDVEQDWASMLSLEEEQLLAFTRLLLAHPRFAFLDRVHSALSAEHAAQILLMLSLRSISYIALDSAKNLPELYDVVLEIGLDGSWKIVKLE
jgi:putative ATP-binding cassette transporter